MKLAVLVRPLVHVLAAAPRPLVKIVQKAVVLLLLVAAGERLQAAAAGAHPPQVVVLHSQEAVAFLFDAARISPVGA